LISLTDTVIKLGNGAILYDPALINQISHETFTEGGWESATAVQGELRAVGRGRTFFVEGGGKAFVIRHFYRGGLIGRLVRDSYLWTGQDKTRAFREYRMLAKMLELGLPVPRPAAARYTRHGLFYRADLITRRIPGVRSLSDVLIEGKAEPSFWKRLGEVIACFHNNRACHADLNAYNIQVSEDQAIYLLDFDRGAFREPGKWERGNLDRLLRSLRKIQLLDSRVQFSEQDWQFLAMAYDAARGRA
jgi:3-deoxy-D-manno-octulosonic acid kinase